MPDDEENYIKVFGFDETFLTVIALLASAFVSVHICLGQNSKKARDFLVLLALLLMVSVQYYHLGNVVTYVPASPFYTYDSNLLRPSCQRSGKGGKRPFDKREPYDLNPCYCLSSVANCTDTSTGQILATNNSFTCPVNSQTHCFYPNSQDEIYPYLSENRDCYGGQDTHCTKHQPCHPCELDSVVSFKSPRCRTCSTDNQGDCNFIPGVGPYCLDSPSSRKVVPCKKCCTEASSPVVVDGRCY
eukprot:gene1900-2078_t